jgi:hypothetical protein
MDTLNVEENFVFDVNLLLGCHPQFLTSKLRHFKTYMNLFFYRLRTDRDVEFTDVWRTLIEQKKTSDTSDSAMIESKNPVLLSSLKSWHSQFFLVWGISSEMER